LRKLKREKEPYLNFSPPYKEECPDIGHYA